jgi:hypothetical protein
MILIRKLARGRLARLILARAPWASNDFRRPAPVTKVTGPNESEEVDCGTNRRGGAQITKRTTITVETERVLVVRTERRL